MASNNIWVAQSGIPVSITGTTALTTLATIGIPGNLMLSNGALKLTLLYNNPAGRTGSWTIQGMFAGATLFSSTLTNAIGTFAGQVMIRAQGATNAQVSAPFFDLGQNGSASKFFAADMTQAQTILVQGQLATSTDTMTLEGYTLELLSP